MGVSIRPFLHLRVAPFSARYRTGAFVVFIRLSPRWLEDQTSKRRETGRRTLEPITVVVAFKMRQSLGASVSASLTVCSAQSWSRRQQFGHHPISFVGSRVPRAYPLRQETGIVTGRANQNNYFEAYPLSPYYPPTRRERSTDKYPRSTPFALHCQT